MKVLLNGRGGKVGSVLGPALEAAGHELVSDLRKADAMVDFTTPDAVVPNIEAAVDAGVPSVVGTSAPISPKWGRAPPELESPSSTRRTSRSERC